MSLCQGIAVSTGKQCRKSAMKGSNYCSCHQHYTPPTIPNSPLRNMSLCQGIAASTGKQCRKSAMKGSNYCSCHQHYTPPTSAPTPERAPASEAEAEFPQVERTDTKDFRISNLPEKQGGAVWDYRQHKDAYTQKSKGSLESEGCCSCCGGLDLDHVLEIHVVRDAYDQIQPIGVGFSKRKELLKKDLTKLLNQPENLNFTPSEVNQLKFRGVHKFQQDYYSQKQDEQLGLVHYLKLAQYGDKRLSRSVTSRIQKEIVRSYDSVTGGLVLDERAPDDQLLAFLHSNMVAMDLF